MIQRDPDVTRLLDRLERRVPIEQTATPSIAASCASITEAA
jgi:hypothetical protein